MNELLRGRPSLSQSQWKKYQQGNQTTEGQLAKEIERAKQGGYQRQCDEADQSGVAIDQRQKPGCTRRTGDDLTAELRFENNTTISRSGGIVQRHGTSEQKKLRYGKCSNSTVSVALFVDGGWSLIKRRSISVWMCWGCGNRAKGHRGMRSSI